MPYAYLHPRPALTVDCAVFGFDAAELKVLLITRKLPPFRNRWALPGGFVRIEETLDDAARRELTEETGLDRVFLEQLYTFGAIRRDPRERVVSVAYYALVPLSEQAIRAATDASDAAWFPATRTPLLAFDHAEILATALRRLRAKVRYQPIGFELLPAKFTLSQLQYLYEAVLETEFDKRNFRKRILGTGLLVPLSERVRVGAHRPARLFRFDTATYEKLIKRGFNFEL
jgi:8-oxo-dGTP diphosphatase